MRRLVLDAGPLIALLSASDDRHFECVAGFAKLPVEFGSVLTPLPILFEVYKFVARSQSPAAAQKALAIVVEDTVIVPLDLETFQNIYSMVCQIPNWQGSLEDASVVAIATQYNASVWTLDYRDLSWFKNIELWTP
ncbi:MAG: PIN domain-containing protein [Hydrococcus sp. Prado102]|jgi:predicted nucleic acid-binding protein|nr:PIN domain-containing protein [Hydrococcus sp. Prado102]